ncbi:unnamed protein product, partial [Phaeothamnion confervicola]
MSLGFLTESALLPSKAKPINVDGRSMLDLKALVFEREQQQRADGDGDDVEGGVRHRRGLAARRPADGKRRKEDLFSRSNRGIEERQERDSEARASKKRKVSGMMQAKAALYEKMASGAFVGEGEAVLVDFTRKTDDDLERL